MIIALLSAKEPSESILRGTIAKKLDAVNNVQMALGKNGETIVYPLDYPSSIVSVLRVLSIADACIMVVNEEISSLDAELALAIEYSGLVNGAVVYSEASDIGSFSKFFSNYSIGRFNKVKVGEQLKLHADAPMVADSLKYISIDKHFIVKGIGNVILGFTLRGKINKGEKLFLIPSLKEVTVKNIQVMDVDVASAESGLHVGLALNNVNEEDLDFNYGISSSRELNDLYSCKLIVSDFFKADPVVSKGLCCSIFGKSLSLSLHSEGENKKIKLNKPVIKATGKHVLADASLSVGKNRIVGNFEFS